MKRLPISLLLSPFIVLLFSCSGGPSLATTKPSLEQPVIATGEPVMVKVRVHGVSDARGTINVGLYTGKDTWLSPNYTYAKTEPVGEVGEVVELIVPNVPAGIYAISLYQDLEENGDLSRDGFGIPTDPWGMSNDAQGSFGPPSFEDATIHVRPPESTFDINLRRGLGLSFGSPGPTGNDT